MEKHHHRYFKGPKYVFGRKKKLKKKKKWVDILNNSAISVDEHFVKDKNLHFSQYLMLSANCLNKYSDDLFNRLDITNTKH